jgi:nicotinate-nucleotide adenylyltransferase
VTFKLLLGGSFDPVHQGHLEIAEKVSEKYQGAGITFVPNYQNPLKKGAIETRHRLEMLELSVKSPHEILKFEIEKQSPSYTIDTLNFLKEQSEADLVWIIGADCLSELHLWKDIERIKELCKFQIITRPGFDTGDVESIFLDLPFSSTKIREALGRGESPDGLDENVLSYIREKGLYAKLDS